MAKLVWTEEALRWLEDIFEYIAQDNPDAAALTVQGIYDRAQALTRHPPPAPNSWRALRLARNARLKRSLH